MANCGRNGALIGVSVASLVMLMPRQVWAQSGPSADSAAEQSGIPEIVVTAQKRSQSIQNVAAAITAFGGDQLKDRGLGSVADIAQSVPSVNFGETNGVNRVTIRGVGDEVLTGESEPSVTQHIDGIFQPQATLPTVASVDLERVEVLRGPQGTLYGRNATGGTINFITAKPTDTLHAGFDGGVGSWNGWNLDGYVSGPVVKDALLARVSAYYEQNNGYYINDFNGHRLLGGERYGVRGALRWLPSEQVTVDLSAYYQHAKSAGPIQTLLRGVNPTAAGLQFLGILAPNAVQSSTAPNHTYMYQDPTSSLYAWGSTLDIHYENADGLSIRSLTGYVNHKYGPSFFEADGVGLTAAGQTSGFVTIGAANGTDPRIQTTKTFSEELNISGKALDGKLILLGGVYYLNSKNSFLIPAYFPNPLIQSVLGAGAFGPTSGVSLLGFDQSLAETAKAFALFGDVTYSLTDSVRLNGGIRASFDSKDDNQSFIFRLSQGGFAFSQPACSNLIIKQKFNRVNGKARAEWDVAKHVMAYVQWQTGYKDGGVSIASCNNTFLPEMVTSFEGGLKLSTLGGRLTANLAAFHYDYKNLQFLDFKGAASSIVANIPKARTSGGELEIALYPTKGLEFDANASILDTKILNYSAIDAENPAGTLTNLAGFRLPNSPKATAKFGAQYTADTGAGALTLRLEYFLSAAYNFRLFNNAADRQDAYEIGNILVTYEDPSKRYKLRGFVKNVFNTHYLSNLFYSSLSGIAGAYAPPRRWGIELSAKY